MLKRVLLLFALSLLGCARSTTATRQDGNIPGLDARVEGRQENAPEEADAAAADCDGGQPFADPIVEAGVRAALGKPIGLFTPDELARVTVLYADGAVSLDGVQCLPALEVLAASDGAISDLSPLKELLSLRTVILDSNRIRSLLPLSGHNELSSIGVIDNQITSLEGLVLGQCGCCPFNIHRNPVDSSDVQPFCDLDWVVTWGGAGGAAVEQCNLLCLF